MVVKSNADALYIIEKLISHRRDSNSHVASIQITLTLRRRAILTHKNVSIKRLFVSSMLSFSCLLISYASNAVYFYSIIRVYTYILVTILT